MIDLERQFGIVFPQRVVREFRKVHDGVDAAQVLLPDFTDVAVDGPRECRYEAAIAEKPPIAVVPRVHAHDVMAM